jgi:hypothetical protein
MSTSVAQWALVAILSLALLRERLVGPAKAVGSFALKIVGGIFVGISLDTVLASIFWGGIHGTIWYGAMISILGMGDHELARGTAALIGATAYFERTHAERTAQRVRERVVSIMHKVARREHEDIDDLREVMADVATMPEDAGSWANDVRERAVQVLERTARSSREQREG